MPSTTSEEHVDGPVAILIRPLGARLVSTISLLRACVAIAQNGHHRHRVIVDARTDRNRHILDALAFFMAS